MIGIQKELPLDQVITELFRDFKDDEVGGQQAVRGFNFQVWHAVLEALKAYQTGQDYAVVLEWQQDVAVLNSSTAPTTVRFIQLKKNESSLHWKLNSLVSTTDKPDETLASSASANDDTVIDSGTGDDGRPAKKALKAKAQPKPKQSFLAKLYAHRRRFKDLAQARLEFTSNAKFEIPNAEGMPTVFSSVDLLSLDKKTRDLLESKVRVQLSVPDGEGIDFSDFSLLVSECPINDAHKHVAGELAEMQLGGQLKLTGASTMLAVLVIASYIHQRAGTLRFAKNLEELLSRAVTRNDIDIYLAAANDARTSTEELVQEVINRLNSELAPFILVSQMKRAVSLACSSITNRAGPTPTVAAHLKALFEQNLNYATYPKVIDMFSAWHDDFKKLALPDEHLYKREYLYCLMSMIIQNANPIQQLPSVSTGSQLKDTE
ncbi:dsDNA nuclease domain-containing protein [Herbaspirillum huttiense]|uniref:dsDNA nuclease domain-containing protein n=1 Tax=Herbaspirillum huttiense TaxID=863372 RepID=UPI003B3BC69D